MMLWFPACFFNPLGLTDNSNVNAKRHILSLLTVAKCCCRVMSNHLFIGLNQFSKFELSIPYHFSLTAVFKIPNKNSIYKYRSHMLLVSFWLNSRQLWPLVWSGVKISLLKSFNLQKWLCKTPQAYSIRGSGCKHWKHCPL